LLSNLAIRQLMHFLMHVAQSLFYFMQNVVYIINLFFLFVKIIFEFYVNGALKLKLQSYQYKGNVTFFQFLYIFMFL